MEDVTRKRLMRMLENLPESQLYQAIDYIEFLEVKHAAESARKPDAFQRFAERVEDGMRVRSLAPKAMKGTMKIMSTAGRIVDGVRDLGRDLVKGSDRDRGEASGAGGRPDPRTGKGRTDAPRGPSRVTGGGDEGGESGRPEGRDPEPGPAGT